MVRYWMALAAFLFVVPGDLRAHGQDGPAGAKIGIKSLAATFGALPKFGNLTLSPDGKYLAYIVPVDGRRHVIIQPGHIAEGDQLGIVPPIPDGDVMWIRWANKDHLLVAQSFEVLAQKGGHLETRLISVPIDGTEAMNIVDESDVPPEFIFPFYSQVQTTITDILPADPGHIVLALDPDRDGFTRLYKVNVDKREPAELIHGVWGRYQTWIVDQQGLPRIGLGVRTGKERVGFRRLGTDRWSSHRKSDWFKSGFRPVGLTEDPAIAYAVGPIDGKDGLVTIDLPNDEIDELIFSQPEYDIDSILYDRSGRRAIGVRYMGDLPETYYFDPKFQKIQEMIDQLLPGTSNRIVDYLPDLERYLILQVSDRLAGDYHVLDLQSKQLYFLVSRMPTLDPDQMRPVQPVTASARDGTPLPSYLTLPDERFTKPYAAVLMPHGGPDARATQEFSYLTQFLAHLGYAVLEPNFRGSTGYGSDFHDAGYRQWGGVMQDDLTDAAGWLIDQGIADPERLCIVGWSYGGYAALMGAVKTPDLFRCAASINGVTNLPRLVGYERRFVGGSMWSKSITLDGEGRKTASPYYRYEEIKIPIFLAAATDDLRVPISQSRQLYKKLQDRVPVTFVQLDSGGHSLIHEESRVKMLEALAEFLDKQIGFSSQARQSRAVTGQTGQIN